MSPSDTSVADAAALLPDDGQGTRPTALLVSLSVGASWVVALVLPVSLALGWEVAVGVGIASGRLLPPPSVVFGTFDDLAATGELATHVLATLRRVLFGFVCGVVAATALGALTGYSLLARRLFDPMLQALRCKSLDLI